MVALAAGELEDEHPYTMRRLRDLLQDWGEVQAGGAHWRRESIRDATGIQVNTGGKHGSRPPCAVELLDVGVAFANLNPAHRRLGWDGDRSWLVHVPLNDRQRVIWAYYVGALAERPALMPPAHTGNPAIDQGPAGEEQATKDAERRERLVGRRPSEQSLRAVAERLGCSKSTAYRGLVDALDALLAEINDLAGQRRR